jgi:hypothetical protein
MSGVSIQQKVATKIAESGPAVEDIIVGKLVQAELSKRTELVMKGMGILDTLRKDLKKIDKPDIEGTFNAEGQPNNDAKYTKGKIDEITKAKQKVEKLTKAIDEALEKNDGDSYGKLNELIK